MTILKVVTRNAVYRVDRDNNRWKRTASTHPRHDDYQWVDGGFTLGEIGERCFAHFDNHPDQATGRWTSSVVSIEELP